MGDNLGSSSLNFDSCKKRSEVGSLYEALIYLYYQKSAVALYALYALCRLTGVSTHPILILI